MSNGFLYQFDEKEKLKLVDFGSEMNQTLSEIRLTNPAAYFARRMKSGGYEGVSENEIGRDAIVANILSGIWNETVEVDAKTVISNLICKVVEKEKKLEYQKAKNDFLNCIQTISKMLIQLKRNHIDSLKNNASQVDCDKYLLNAMVSLSHLYYVIDDNNGWFFEDLDLDSDAAWFKPEDVNYSDKNSE